MTRSRSLFEERNEVEKRQLIVALEKAGGNQSEAARILGVSRVTVWSRMKKYRIRLKRKIGDENGDTRF